MDNPFGMDSFRGKGRWVPLFVRTEQVDGETIKADTWYILKGGKFVECDEQ